MALNENIIQEARVLPQSTKLLQLKRGIFCILGFQSITAKLLLLNS